MSGEPKSLIQIYEENISAIQRKIKSGNGSARKNELRVYALARLKYKLERAQSGCPLPTYAEETRRKDRLYAIR